MIANIDIDNRRHRVNYSAGVDISISLAFEMENHHRYWGITPNSRLLPEGGGSNRSITEFVFVPDTVLNSAHDGQYLPDLQVSPFALDAAPKRPILYKLEDDVS
ncbi:MAG: hypothetical protein ACC655_01990 [Rhodothermia bacterium]